jgi:hypothetical protein
VREDGRGMPDWWPRVELDPDNFSLERISSYYPDFGLAFENMDAPLRAVLVTISLAFLAEFFGIVLGVGLEAIHPPLDSRTAT